MHGPTPIPRTPTIERGAILALVLICLAQAMLVLDITVVNVALPVLSADLGIGPALRAWGVAAYAVPFGGLLLLGGRLSDLFGARRMMLVGLAVFTVASFAAGFVQSPIEFFAARAGQGIGAALLSPAALSTLLARFEGASRVRALAVWGAVGGAGSALGVLLGGLLTGGPGWRWIFIINVPTGLLLLVTVPLVVSRIAPSGRGRVDVVGALLGTLGFASTILSITTIAATGHSFLTTALGVLGGVSLILFVVVEKRVASPLIRLGLLASRPLAAGAALMLVATGLLVGSLFILSFLLQAEHGWTPTATGFAFLPIALAIILGAHLAGRAVSSLGARHVAPAALLVAATGLGLAWVGVGSGSLGLAIAAFSLAALGLGAAFVCASTTALSTVSMQESGAASGALSSFHELGSAVGVAVLGSVAVGGLSPAIAVAAGIAVATAVVAWILVPAGRPAAGAARFAH